MQPLTLLIVFVIIILLWLVLTFNSLVRLRNTVNMSFAGIDVQLKRRADLIPNLVATVKEYASYEKNLLEQLTKIRTSLLQASRKEDVHEMANSDDSLQQTLKSLFAVAENYPDLKANQNFLKLQEQLSETEDQIAASRRIYNQNTMYYNTKIESFPSLLVAKLFSFKKKDLFKTDNREPVRVN